MDGVMSQAEAEAGSSGDWMLWLARVRLRQRQAAVGSDAVMSWAEAEAGSSGVGWFDESG